VGGVSPRPPPQNFDSIVSSFCAEMSFCKFGYFLWGRSHAFTVPKDLLGIEKEKNGRKKSEKNNRMHCYRPTSPIGA